MTDKDYIAISNTGKNITVSMTHGMKQRVLGSHGRIRLRLGVDNSMRALAIVPCAPGYGYRVYRRKNVWSMSMSSKWLAGWPKHERFLLGVSQLDMTDPGAIIMLPKPSAPIPDKPIATPKKWLSGPILNQIEPRQNEPGISRHHISLAGEYFEVQVNSEDHARFWKAYLRTLEKTEASHLFKTIDMIVAAITGACFGFLVALALSAAGLLS